ncbi:PilW family protein [Pseudomonas sp. RIT-PI-AD]|uniref:PilW family protein n=1 Tax=Pseudomonas sp. RIT-PI-AD TaxID=3035294 RepID=UPI0021D9EA30|nr:PilW family protein [Pseudomonas sp. RIT-PI-AD]
MKSKKYQSGLSLVELMVALAISSFLILGVTQIYIDNKRSYTFQQNQAENQEGSRFTLLLLQQELAKAGYRRRPDTATDVAFPTVSASGCDFSAGAGVAYNSASSICIRYQPRDKQDRDCLGNLPANLTDIANPYTTAKEFFIERLYLNGNDLMCTSTHVDETGAVKLASATATLLSNVADLRFELGIGSNTEPRAVLSYTKASTTAPILSIRYTALMRSSNPNLRDSVDASSALANWKALTGATDSEVNTLKTADKGQLYQVSQGTVMLRNLMP